MAVGIVYAAGSANELRSRLKAIERSDPGNNGCQGSWNLGISGVSPMIFPVDQVGVECTLYLDYRARELNDCTSAGNLVNCKSIASEPCLDSLQVSVTNAKALTELIGAQELVIVRRVFVLNRLKICGGLLPAACCASEPNASDSPASRPAQDRCQIWFAQGDARCHVREPLMSHQSSG